MIGARRSVAVCLVLLATSVGLSCREHGRADGAADRDGAESRLVKILAIDGGGARGIIPAISSEAMLSEAATNVVLTTYNLTDRPPRTYELSRWKARHGDAGGDPEDHDFRMWQAVRAASTFPGIWPGATLHAVSGRAYYPLDGGMFAINPVLEGLAHALRLLRAGGLEGRAPGFLVVSLGTGYYNQTDLVGETTQGWGPEQWYRRGAVPNVLEVLFEGQADAAVGLLRDLHVNDERVRHAFRFQPRLERDFELDDVDAESLAALRSYAEAMVRRRQADIETICALLEEGRALPEVLEE